MLTYKNKTQQEWIDEINSYTLDEKITEVIPLVLDDPTPTYSFSSLPPSYASLVMENKPKISFFNAELSTYKALEIERIGAIFVDLEAREVIVNRLAAIKHPASACASLNYPNYAITFKKAIDERNGTLVSAIEVAGANIDKQIKVKDAYDQMNADVYDEMYQVFGTNNADSAVAYERTWEMMKSDPDSWSLLGLKDLSGNALDTAQKVTDFVTNKLASVEAYGKWRMQRIEQFRELRASILS